MKRKIYKHLIAWKGKRERKPLVVKGARQVGKTYILKEFGAKDFVNFHYLNFEKDESLKAIFKKDLNPGRIIQEIMIYLNKKINIQQDLLIFDEIQEIPRAITSLKYFNEEMPELAICVAGSLIGVTLNEESFPVGKVEFLNMYPMSFDEFLLGVGNNLLYENLLKFDDSSDIVHQKMWELLKHYFIVGGLPEVVKTYRNDQENLYDAFKNVRKKQDDLITAYQADMAKHSGKQNAMHIERLWRNIPRQLAREQEGKDTKFVFKGVIPGIKGFDRLSGIIDWLETAGLILKVPLLKKAETPLAAYASDNNFKLYIFDIGILGALSQLSIKSILDYDYGSYKGYYAENYVAQSLREQGIFAFYYWKGRTSEVEFVFANQDKVIPVEVKAGNITQSKSLNIFSQKYSVTKQFTLSARRYSTNQAKDKFYIPLYLSGQLRALIDKL
jgi:uncharacterized protein